MAEKFTESKLKSLPVKEKVYSVRDSECGILYVRVQPTGKKTYYVQFKSDLKQVKSTLAPVGQISLADARDMAREKRAGKERGTMPPRGFKIKDLIKDFLEVHVSEKKEKTQADYRRHMKWMVENFGEWEIREIDEEQASKIVAMYGKGTKAQGNKFLATARKCWRFGRMDGRKFTSENPFDSVTKKEEKTRDVYASDNQLKRIIESVLAEKNEFSRAYHFTIIMTMCRRGEADKMKWEQITDRIWEKPREMTKASKIQRIYLIDEVFEILDSLPRNTRDGFMFNKFQGWSNAWKRILKRANLPYPGIRVHDMRRSVAIHLLKEGKATVQQISLMLGHSSVDITQRVYAPYIGSNEDTAMAIGSLL